MERLRVAGLMFAKGGSMTVTKPTLFLAGEAGAEDVTVRPRGGWSGSSMNIVGLLEDVLAVSRATNTALQTFGRIQGIANQGLGGAVNDLDTDLAAHNSALHLFAYFEMVANRRLMQSTDRIEAGTNINVRLNYAALDAWQLQRLAPDLVARLEQELDRRF